MTGEGYGLKSLHENHAFPTESRRDGLRVAQDVVLGIDKQAGQFREGRLNSGVEFSDVPTESDTHSVGTNCRVLTQAL
jgi:hypothetical protein